MGVGRFLNTTESQTDAMYTVHSRDLSGTSKDRNKEENLRALWVSGRLGRTQLVRVHPTTHITFYRIPSHDVTSHHIEEPNRTMDPKGPVPPNTVRRSSVRTNLALANDDERIE
mmetsp:Transcript_12023/g.28103  ORF Transcript_12023/g.28103 Transcript_12023/m.28103 type:complete len:114 (+) Transcript_12023:336-677(+)